MNVEKPGYYAILLIGPYETDKDCEQGEYKAVLAIDEAGIPFNASLASPPKDRTQVAETLEEIAKIMRKHPKPRQNGAPDDQGTPN